MLNKLINVSIRLWVTCAETGFKVSIDYDNFKDWKIFRLALLFCNVTYNVALNSLELGDTWLLGKYKMI